MPWHDDMWYVILTSFLGIPDRRSLASTCREACALDRRIWSDVAVARLPRNAHWRDLRYLSRVAASVITSDGRTRYLLPSQHADSESTLKDLHWQTWLASREFADPSLCACISMRLAQLAGPTDCSPHLFLLPSSEFELLSSTLSRIVALDAHLSCRRPASPPIARQPFTMLPNDLRRLFHYNDEILRFCLQALPWNWLRHALSATVPNLARLE